MNKISPKVYFVLNWEAFADYTRCPNKNATFLTKHATIAFCSIAKLLFDSKRVCINLDFEILDSPICKIFFEIRKFEDIKCFFQESILGDFRGINFTHLLTCLSVRIANNGVHLSRHSS